MFQIEQPAKPEGDAPSGRYSRICICKNPTDHHGSTYLINGFEPARPGREHQIEGRGSFRKEIGRSVVPPASKKEIRALLVHHSTQYRSPNGSGTLEMTKNSREALFEWMANNGISVLLCGHTHLPRLAEFKVKIHELTYRFFEACSGATTILTSLPYDATSITLTRSKLSVISNSLLVHRLKLQEEIAGIKVLWQTDAYFETPYGFELWSNLRVGLPAQRGPYHVEFLVPQ